MYIWWFCTIMMDGYYCIWTGCLNSKIVLQSWDFQNCSQKPVLHFVGFSQTFFGYALKFLWKLFSNYDTQLTIGEHLEINLRTISTPENHWQVTYFQIYCSPILRFTKLFSKFSYCTLNQNKLKVILNVYQIECQVA